MRTVEPTFAKLFRVSKFASYDQALPQVYSVPKNLRLKGNWGLKRSLPSSMTTGYVSFTCMDSQMRQVIYQNAASKVSLVNRWKESFPPSLQLPPPLPVQAVKKRLNEGTPFEFSKKHTVRPVNLTQLSESEYRKFLSRVKSRREEWSALISAKQVKASAWKDFLNIMDFEARQSQYWDAPVVTKQKDVEALAKLLPARAGPHPPHYSMFRPSEGVKVLARSLGRYRGPSTDREFTVGIQGAVGNIETGSSLRLKKSELVDFYVKQATLMPQGVNISIAVEDPKKGPSTESLIPLGHNNMDYL